MSRTALWLLALTLLVSGSLASEDYFYDEEAEEEVESTHVPVFSSQPQKFDVMVGDDVTLPCLMDKVTSAIFWSSFVGDRQKALYYINEIPGEGAQQDDRFKLVTSGTKGNSLVINNVRADDSGTYVCKVATTSSEVKLKHTVNVKYAPTVQADPENGVLVIMENKPATMTCNATGNPKPTITWTRESGLLPNGKKKMEGSELAIPSVERTHMGTYACTVDNEIGDAIVKNFRLEVNFSPAIEAEQSVHTGAGHEAQLTCNVSGQPMPKVSWSRAGGAALDDARHRQQHEGAQYSLAIDEVQDSDLGQYTCRARSSLGTAAAPIILTGEPKEVEITSPPQGQQKDTYTLRWTVESYAPVKEYKVTYKIAQTGEGSPKKQWEQVMVPAPSKDDSTVMYSYMHELRDLAPSTTYEAVVTAKNKYGWSQEPKKPFKLHTLGAQEALGSTERGASSSVRSASLAVAAALGALLAAL